MKALLEGGKQKRRRELNEPIGGCAAGSSPGRPRELLLDLVFPYTRHQVIRLLEGLQRRDDLPARLDRERAAGMEGTPGRGRDRARRLALHGHFTAALARV